MKSLADIDDDTGILICGHGSRDTGAIGEFGRLVRELRARLPARAVEPGHLEFARPTIHEGLDALRDKGFTRIVAIPAMLSGGVHVKTDLPAAIEAYAIRYRELDIELTADLSGDAAVLVAAAARIEDAMALADERDGPVPRDDTLLIVAGGGSSDADVQDQ